MFLGLNGLNYRKHVIKLIYPVQVSERYKCHEKKSLPPHIFAVADRAYQSMLGRLATGPKNQCIVIRFVLQSNEFTRTSGFSRRACLRVF